MQDVPERSARVAAAHWRGSFNPGLQVAIHPICTTDVEVAVKRIGLTRAEPEDATVFEEPPHYRANLNVLTQPGHGRTQAAEAAHDEINLHPSFAGAVQRIHHAAIFKLIHLGNDPACTARGGNLRLAINQLKEALLHGYRRHQQLPILALA